MMVGDSARLSWLYAVDTRAEQNQNKENMTKLYVGGLPYSMTDEGLLQLFADKGYQPVSANIITERETGRSRGFGFVELGQGDDAAKAIGELNGLNVEGRALQVNEARPQESRGGSRTGGRPGGGRGFSGGRSGRGGRGRY
jgi:cold-inducible RNA-binding protein